MSEFLQQVINGLSLGAIYALIALGYTMIYGVLRFINFAHGDVFMVGAYIGFFAFPKLQPLLGDGYGTALAVIVAAMLGCGLLGVVIERLAYRPLRGRPKLTVLITAIGVSLFLEYTGQLPMVFGADYKTFPTLIPDAAVDPFWLAMNMRIVFGVAAFFLLGRLRDRLPQRFSHIAARTALAVAVGSAIAWLALSILPTIGAVQLIVFDVTLVLMLLLRLVVLHTKIGTAMRAVSMNMSAASLMGINTNMVISFTFFLGSALAGAGAVLYAISYPKINPLMGVLPGLKAFVAAVLGGIGNIAGATLGGFLIGIAETMTAGYISPTFRDAIVFGILILILILKPSGLLGKGGAEKV